MLDIKRIRKNPQELIDAMAKRRGKGVDVSAFLEIEERRRKLMAEVEEKKATRNSVSADIAIKAKAKEDTEALKAAMRSLGEEIKALETELNALQAEVDAFLYRIPNIPHESVPEGSSDEDNVELRRGGTPRAFAFTPKPHWELGEALDILDFARAGKITGSRFCVLKGAGAKLNRAIISYFLDVHAGRDYHEIAPPYMVNRASMTGTGQLPKFAEDSFAVSGTDYFLIPTAEVPITNLHRDEILQAAELPIRYCGYSANFRSEAGSAGRDTRGLIRMHQFDKVELVQYTKPEDSYAALEQLTRDAEQVLQGLCLPYRVVTLSTGDLGFSAAKTYDLEVWMPSYGRYVEISSCSNFEDFQARRAQIRFRRTPGAKPELVHTLNGSGVAVGRTLAAIIENYQNADGSITVPEVLKPYMNMERIQ
ncbi:MAG: serine--tRNA ligase [Clostridiales bacterium]|nr:serine--tRNA ligase [Clostridiales bacterium]